MTNLDFDRITNPLRLAKGSHQEGSGKGCAMNVISYINGDKRITDYPKCSAKPLAVLVQLLNDKLAGPDGFLSPQDSITVLDLGWDTVGTADVPDTVVYAWLSELLDSSWGILKFSEDKYATEIGLRVAYLLHSKAYGHPMPLEEYYACRLALITLVSIPSYIVQRTSIVAKNALNTLYYGAELYGEGASFSTGDSMAVEELTEFTRSAISAWRRLGRLDEVTVDEEVTDLALQKMMVKA